MKITNIKLNKNGKYVVTIDNEKYNLYQDTILKYLLFSKKEIDNTLFENIIKDNNFYDAYYKIIKFVSIRLRTENEIRSYKGETLWDYLVKAKKSEKKSI